MDASPDPSVACVLVVDEDAETRHVLRLLFEFENFEVVEASGAVEVLTRLLRCSPQFIVFHGEALDPSLQRALPSLRRLIPDVRVVACAPTLEEKPSWADAFLNGARITDVSPLLSDLVLKGVA